MLHGSNLIAWRENLDLSVGTPPTTQLPATLVVINPEDREEPQLRASQRTIVPCQSDAVVSEAAAQVVGQVVSAPHYHPSHQPHHTRSGVSGGGRVRGGRRGGSAAGAWGARGIGSHTSHNTPSTSSTPALPCHSMPRLPQYISHTTITSHATAMPCRPCQHQPYCASHKTLARKLPPLSDRQMGSHSPLLTSSSSLPTPSQVRRQSNIGTSHVSRVEGTACDVALRGGSSHSSAPRRAWIPVSSARARQLRQPTRLASTHPVSSDVIEQTSAAHVVAVRARPPVELEMETLPPRCSHPNEQEVPGRGGQIV